MNNAFFFQTQQIPDDTILFNEFQQQNIFFSYFQADQNYYLFVYAQKSIQIDFLYHSIDVIQELDSKQRKIRSFRGFFLYALEIMVCRRHRKRLSNFKHKSSTFFLGFAQQELKILSDKIKRVLSWNSYSERLSLIKIKH